MVFFAIGGSVGTIIIARIYVDDVDAPFCIIGVIETIFSIGVRTIGDETVFGVYIGANTRPLPVLPPSLACRYRDFTIMKPGCQREAKSEESPLNFI